VRTFDQVLEVAARWPDPISKILPHAFVAPSIQKATGLDRPETAADDLDVEVPPAEACAEHL
jgi:hypothetical protein